MRHCLLCGASIGGVCLIAGGGGVEVVRGDAGDVLLLLLPVLTHVRSADRE